MRAIRDREIVVRAYVDDEGGTLTAPDSLPTIAVVNGSGTAVAGVSAVTLESVGVYKATIPPQAQFDDLHVTWTIVIGGVTRKQRETIFVVADRLVPLHRLREDAELTALSPVNIL